MLVFVFVLLFVVPCVWCAISVLSKPHFSGPSGTRYIVPGIYYQVPGTYLLVVTATGAPCPFATPELSFLHRVLRRVFVARKPSFFFLHFLSFPRRAQEHLDARLTEFGKEQCASLKATSHGIDKEAQLVVVSPLTRAIQTAMLSIDQVRPAARTRTRSMYGSVLPIGFVRFIDLC